MMTGTTEEPSKTAVASPDLPEIPVAETLGKARLDGEGALAQQVYRLLRQLIVNIRLLPNQFLPEKDVATILGVSKTPVREAFIRLSEDELVDIVPKIGTYVAPINLKRAFKGYFIRAALETACVDKLARERSEEALGMLWRELEAQRASLARSDYNEFYIQDNHFHSMLFEAAELPNARRVVEAAKSELDRVRGLKSIYRFYCHEDEVFGEHVAIYEAIARGDPDGARGEVDRHLAGMNEAISTILKEERLWGLFNSINHGGVRGWR